MAHWARSRIPTLPKAQLDRIPSHVEAWQVAYWQLQHELTQRHIIPYLVRWDALPSEGRILEVGSAHAGCLGALCDATGLGGDGIELSDERFEIAQAIDGALGDGRLRLAVGDITAPAILEGRRDRYSLILLRDVIEHIEAPHLDAALLHCAAMLAPGGHIFLSFPPYYSPFGAHQQILGRRSQSFPFAQLIPGFIGRVRRGEADPNKVAEMESLDRCSLTLGRFERALSRTSLARIDRCLFALRPVFELRYGLRPLGAGLIAHLPVVRELFTTGAWYLLRRPSA